MFTGGADGLTAPAAAGLAADDAAVTGTSGSGFGGITWAGFGFRHPPVKQSEISRAKAVCFINIDALAHT